MEAFVQLISNVGFPIACCVALFWFVTKTMNGMKDTLEALKQTVENNTAVVEKLNKRIDKLEENKQ